MPAWYNKFLHLMGPAIRPTDDHTRSMLPIDAVVAVIWATFLSIVTLVLAYYGFVVADRQELAIERSVEDATETAAPDASSAS